MKNSSSRPPGVIEREELLLRMHFQGRQVYILCDCEIPGMENNYSIIFLGDLPLEVFLAFKSNCPANSLWVQRKL